MGEIRTCPLRNSTTLALPLVVQLLELIPGRVPLWTERPLTRVVSSDLVTGVDCQLAALPRTKARGIGTVACRAMVTGGTVLQSSALTRLVPANTDRRLAWPHYAARTMTVEVIGKATPQALGDGFLANERSDTVLDLGAISTRIINLVQRSQHLDHKVSLRARPTRVRWVARIGAVTSPS